MNNKIKYKGIIALFILSIVWTAFSKTDSILVLAEKCSYQFAASFPDSLDAMYYDPLVWIKEGIGIAADSKGNDLNGYVFLLDCYYNGKIKCIKSTGPNKIKYKKIAKYLDTTQFKPWKKEISNLYGLEPVKLLVTWSKEYCSIERIINKKDLKDEDSKLFIRKWNGFNF